MSAPQTQHPPPSLSVCLSVCLCLPVSVSVCLCLSVCLSVCLSLLWGIIHFGFLSLVLRSLESTYVCLDAFYCTYHFFGEYQYKTVNTWADHWLPSTWSTIWPRNRAGSAQGPAKLNLNSTCAGRPTWLFIAPQLLKFCLAQVSPSFWDYDSFFQLFVPRRAGNVQLALYCNYYYYYYYYYCHYYYYY